MRSSAFMFNSVRRYHGNKPEFLPPSRVPILTSKYILEYNPPEPLKPNPVSAPAVEPS